MISVTPTGSAPEAVPNVGPERTRALRERLEM
jgi:hypothetical protein